MTTTDGRRYRLPDWLGGHEVQIINEEAGSARVTIDCPDSAGDCWLPKRWLEPVGLDMAEPDDGAVVRVTGAGSAKPLLLERDDARARIHEEQNWWGTGVGVSWSWAEIMQISGVSITVLEPRRQCDHAELRRRLVEVRNHAANQHAAISALTGGNSIGSVHNHYRNQLTPLITLVDEWDSGSAS